MTFFVRGAGQWIRSFLKADARTPLGQGCPFGSADKVPELVARTSTKMVLEDRNAFEYGISNGRGGLWLELTAAQYAALRQ